MESDQQPISKKFFSRATANQRLIAAGIFLVIAGGFSLGWLMGQFHFTLYPFPCGFKQRYNLPCPTCGMTTAVIAFSHGHIIDAFSTQPAAGFLCCISAVIAFFAFIVAVFGVYSSPIERRLVSLKLRYIFAALLLIFAAGWALTLARAIAQNSGN
ncbi:MAG: DUF2752 domain-containing protein [Sedimentisphaerales bacterium]|jgi:hypothetical protein